MITFTNLNSFVLLCIFKYGKTVPIEYCLHPLNKSDCGLNPTSVFSYYKPGSRCEIELWRGCPTLNKFPDEYLCSHHCIGKLFGRADDDIQSLDFVDYESEDEELDECNLSMNEKDCGIQEHKYTFRDNQCVLAIWKGCASQNLFEDEASCMEACSETQNLHFTSNFEDELESLPLEDVKDIIQILDNVLVNNATAPSIVNLKHTLPIKTTTPSMKTTQPSTTTEEETKATTEVPTSATVASISTIVDSTTEIITTKEIITGATAAFTTEISIETLGTTETTEAITMTNKHQEVTTPDDSSGSVDEVIVT